MPGGRPERGWLGAVALGALLLLVAGTFDAEPFYVTGAALVLLGAGTALWIHLAARGATLSRTVPERRVMEGEPMTVRLEVRAGRLPLAPGHVREGLLDVPAPVPAGRRRQGIRIEVAFGRRGRRVLEAPVLVLRDPLGLAERTVTGPTDDEVLVLPRVEAVRVAAGGGDAAGRQARALLTTAAETELDGLRPHAENAPAARIHWPSAAKGGELMERRLVAEADSRPLVVLDPRGAPEPDALDAAVRAAASLTVFLARRTGCALLLPGDRRVATVDPDLLAWPTAHVRLALLDDAAGPSLAAAHNRRGLVVFVTPRGLERPPAGLGRTPGGVVLVTPRADNGRRPLFEVAGCQGRAVGRTGAASALATVAGAGG